MSQKPHFAASDELQLCAAPPLSLFGGLLSTGGRGGVQKPGFEFQSDAGAAIRAQTRTAPKVRLRGRKVLCMHTSFFLSQEGERQLPPAHLLGALCFEATAQDSCIGCDEGCVALPKQPARLRLQALLLFSACYPSLSSVSFHESKTQTQVCLSL